MNYHARTFDHLKGLHGFSDQLVRAHLGLYRWYAKNTNHLAAVLLNKVKLEKANTIEYAEMKRRFGWDFKGMRLHEYDFENLTPTSIAVNSHPRLYRQIEKDFGRYELWDGVLRVPVGCEGSGGSSWRSTCKRGGCLICGSMNTTRGCL